jgi:hypothetical protein
MKSPRLMRRLVALLGIGAGVLAAPALAQDGPESVGLRGSPGSAADGSGQGRVAGGEAAESDGAAAAITKTARDPQIVIWTDDRQNYVGSVAHNPVHDEFIVGWTTQQDQYSHDIWARRLRPDGTLLEHFNVTNVAGERLSGPEIAYCPLHDEYLIAYTNWYDNSGDRADVQARRVAWDGGWMGSVITITPGVAVHYQPSIAYCGPCDEYVVTYTSYWVTAVNTLYAQRIRAADGAPLGMNCVASGGEWDPGFSSIAFHPAAYGGAGGYLIAYRVIASGGSVGKFSYKMAQTDLSDVTSNPALDVSSTALPCATPRVSAGQTGFLIAWWEETGGGTFRVRARRISAEGVALGPPEGIAVSGEYATNPTWYFKLGVTYAYPGLYLVLWEHQTPGGIVEIHGIFVSEDADTTVGDEAVLSGTGTNMAAPAAICSPMSDCLVVYEWWNTQTNSYDIAGDIARLVVMFEDGFESGDTSAWSATVP